MLPYRRKDLPSSDKVVKFRCRDVIFWFWFVIFVFFSQYSNSSRRQRLVSALIHSTHTHVKITSPEKCCHFLKHVIMNLRESEIRIRNNLHVIPGNRMSMHNCTLLSETDDRHRFGLNPIIHSKPLGEPDGILQAFNSLEIPP